MINHWTPPMRETNRFKDYIFFKEGKELFDQPHTIQSDPPMRLPAGLERLAEAFKKSKEVSIGKEVDTKAGGEKDVTMKGKKLFVVGGAVRDYLLGHTPKNYDVVTDAHPDEVERIVMNARPSIQVLKKDKKKGQIKVNVDGETYTIETMKKKGGKEEDGATFTANIPDDCERRDFTANALYYEISTKKIHDYCGGLRHIQDGNVKFIGRPEDSASEDGMRKYRYARMVNKMPNGKIDKETKDALSKVESEDLSPDQIREEFWKGMEDLHTNADKYLRTYHDLGLLQTVFPKLTLSLEFPNCKTCKSRPLVIASLLKNNKPQKLVEKLRELKYTDREIKDAVFLINLLVFAPQYVYDYKKELMQCSLTKRQILDWVKLNHLDTDLIEKLLEHKFTVNAQDLMDREGLHGDGLRDRVRNMEAESFMKKMKE